MMAGIVNRANAAAVVLADAGIAVQIEQASAVLPAAGHHRR